MRAAPAAERLSAGLIGSKHDFTQAGAAPRDLCLACHSPHIPVGRAPLLDRRPAATQPIRPYQTLDVRLSSASLLCLSCHDGVVAPDVFEGAHAMDWTGSSASPLAPRRRISHPVGVGYPTANPRFHPLSAVVADGRIQLPDGRVQCTSCHDPHNRGHHRGMLVKSNARSRLCLSCHDL